MIIAITGGRRDERGSVLFPSLHQLRRFWDRATHLEMTHLVHGRAIGTDWTVDQYVKYKNQGWDVVRITPPIPHWSLLRMPDAGIIRRDGTYRTVQILPYPVDIRVDGPFPLAGHKRNARMLRDSKAGVLIAFPGQGGTANCVETGLRMGIGVWQWDGDRERGEFKEIAR